MEAAGKGERTAGLPEVLAFVGALSLLRFACAGVLWWAYSMCAFVAGGAYERNFALSAVTKFGFVLSVLILGIWLRRRKRIAGVRPWRISCLDVAAVKQFESHFTASPRHGSRPSAALPLVGSSLFAACQCMFRAIECQAGIYFLWI